MTLTDFDPSKLPKLVRDNIPDIILFNEGVKAETRVLDGDEYLKALKNKLIEEVFEVFQAQDDITKIQEELADVYEVIETMVKFLKIENKNIQGLKSAKRIKDPRRKQRGIRYSNRTVCFRI